MRPPATLFKWLSILAVILQLAVVPAGAAGGVHFDFGPVDGPDEWATLYPTNCAGRSQSPINILTETTIPVPAATLTIFGGGTSSPFNALAITAHGMLKVNFAGQSIFLNSSLSPYTYVLADVHWHTPGEHVVDGVRYPIERHMVFTPLPRSDITNDTRASRYIVIGTLFDESGSTDDLFLPEAEFNTAGYEANNEPESPAMKNYFTAQPKDLMAGDIQNSFWTYSGSLTTPTCAEIIDWHVSQVVRRITPDVLEALQSFEMLLAVNGTPVSMLNTRPTQPLNGRVVNSRQFSVSVAPNNSSNSSSGSAFENAAVVATIAGLAAVVCMLLGGCIVCALRWRDRGGKARSSSSLGDDPVPMLGAQEETGKGYQPMPVPAPPAPGSA